MMDFFKKNKKIIILISTVLIIIAICILPYILTDTAFILSWDMRTQYSLFYENLKTAFETSIQEGTLPFFSWTTFLGNNFWASKLFYYHDIFDYFFTVFKNLTYSQIVMIQTVIKVMGASLFFYYYCHIRNYSKNAAIYGSICFGFSAWALDSFCNPFFLSFYVFTPLYFACIENYFVKKKISVYILVTAFLAITNYYSFYTLSVFTVFYFVFRYYQINLKFSGLIKCSLPLIGAYFIGVFLSGFALIPELLDIIGNSRLGESSSFLVYDSIKPYFAILLGIFTPTSLFLNHSLEFQSVFETISSNNTVLGVLCWAGSIHGFLIVQSFFSKKRENKFILLLFLLLLIIPLGSSLMHGFSEPSFRWTQFMVFFTIVLTLPYIDRIEIINDKVLKWTYIIGAILMIMLPIVIHNVTAPMEMGFPIEYTRIVLVVISMTIAFLILRKNLEFKYIYLFTVLEITVVAFYSTFGNPYTKQFSNKTVYGVEHVLKDKNELNEYLYTLDEENRNQFYRIYVPASAIYWDYSTNLNLNYNFKGLMSYDSTYSSAILQMNEISSISTYLAWAFDIQDSNLIDYFSTKYAVVSNPDQLPHQNFVEVGIYNDFSVYENINYQNFIRVYDKAISLSEYKKINDSSVILDTLIVDDNMINELSGYLGDSNFEGFDWVSLEQNTFVGDIELKEKGFATISIPFDKGWKIIVNGVEVSTYNVQGGTLGFPLEKGYNHVEGYFVPSGFKLGVVVSLTGLILFIGVVILQYKKNFSK
ncbi:YfhO family protein [Anaerorhabdus furcosa]|uniref:Membrane protein YfhO n=1 Tax=Anaerorhabdus furcosa TaxID=118967 RepID=A0A1T4LUK4_9FIRM|nr:YfhO family protein [Anaerorhabdus furcosa]SJZ58321.1 membrane protein YfhO [Anaerorhabdus furcosa]